MSDDNHPDGKYISNAKGEVELPKEFVQETLYRLEKQKHRQAIVNYQIQFYFVFMKANTTKKHD